MFKQNFISIFGYFEYLNFHKLKIQITSHNKLPSLPGHGCIVKKEEKLCPGNNVETTKEEKKEVCAQKCYDTPRCMAWQFGTPSPNSGTRCWLKKFTNCTLDVPNTDWVWGTRDCKNNILDLDQVQPSNSTKGIE